MLKKLTSPKAKAARNASDAHRGTTDKELSGLAAIPDDGELKDKSDARSSKGASEKPAKSAADQAVAASTDQKQKKKTTTKKPRDELSLDLGALGEATGTEGDGVPQADESLANVRGGSMDRRRTLARSPRTKNILEERGSAADGDAKPTLQGKRYDFYRLGALVSFVYIGSTDVTWRVVVVPPRREAMSKPTASKEPPPPSSPAKEAKSSTSTKKGGLSKLRALTSSGDKSKKEGHESSGDKEIRASGSIKSEGDKHAASSKETNLKSKTNAENKSESKRIDEQDEDKDPASDGKKDRDDPEHRRESNQKTKSSLSPLRRRKPASENDEQPIGRSSKEHLPGHHMKLRGLPPANQPEVHIIGEITSAENFGTGGFACKWGVEYGSLWHHIAGDQLGQTQIDYPSSSSQPIVWSHPIDLHFVTTSFSGWPKLLLQVWQTDTHMKTNVVGYGFMNLPFAPGEHHLTASLWRPMGSAKEELEAKLLGRTQELVSEDVVFNSAWADRCRLQTTATGKVHVQVGVILRNFHTSDLDM